MSRGSTWGLNVGPDGYHWRTRAACRTVPDPEIFFPSPGGDTRPAKRVCRHCPVQAECLAYALRRGETSGVWGGRSPRERGVAVRVSLIVTGDR